MTAKVFIDSNIWLYAFVMNPGEDFKHDRSRGVITGGEQHVISSQVIAEICNNLLRKAGMDEAEVRLFRISGNSKVSEIGFLRDRPR